MSSDSNDPLARFRRKTVASPEEEPQRTLTGHEALGLAINALSQVPDHEPLLQYELGEAYEAGKGRTKLEELAPRMYKTLLLCEDVLSELGRLDDGTPSISALIDIRAIQREAGNLSEEQVIKLMQGTPALALAEPETEAKSEATRELIDAAKVAWQRNSNHEIMTFAECNQLHSAIVHATLEHPHDALTKAMPEQQPEREPSTPAPERDVDLEPDL